jgi:hypothetical protein
MESFNILSADPTGLISIESIDRPLRSKPLPAASAKR